MQYFGGYDFDRIQATNNMREDQLFDDGVLRAGTTFLAAKNVDWPFVVYDCAATEVDPDLYGDKVHSLESFLVSPDMGDSLYGLTFKRWDGGFSKADVIYDRLRKREDHGGYHGNVYGVDTFAIRSESTEIEDGDEAYAIRTPVIVEDAQVRQDNIDQANFVRDKIDD